MRFIKAIISLSLASVALAAPSKQHWPGDGNNDGGYICCYNNDNLNAGRGCFLTSGSLNRAGLRCVYIDSLEEDGPNGDGVRGNSNRGGVRGGPNRGGVDGNSNGGGERDNSDGDDIQANSNGGDIHVNSGEGGGLLNLLNRLSLLNNDNIGI